MKKIILPLMFAIALPSCAAVMSFLPTALSLITDATLVVAQIQSASDNWFAAKPDAETQAKINQAITAVNQSLSVVNNVAQGIDSEQDGRYQDAVAQFQTAFTDLMGLLESIGIVDKSTDREIATSDGVQIPIPRLMLVKVAK